MHTKTYTPYTSSVQKKKALHTRKTCKAVASTQLLAYLKHVRNLDSASALCLSQSVIEFCTTLARLRLAADFRSLNQALASSHLSNQLW